MNPPARRAFNAIHISGGDQDSQNSPQPFNEIAPDFTVFIVFDQALKPSMSDRTNFHLKMYGITVHRSNYFDICNGAQNFDSQSSQMEGRMFASDEILSFTIPCRWLLSGKPTGDNLDTPKPR
jgi:hypothetical protein